MFSHIRAGGKLLEVGGSQTRRASALRGAVISAWRVVVSVRRRRRLHEAPALRDAIGGGRLSTLDLNRGLPRGEVAQH